MRNRWNRLKADKTEACGTVGQAEGGAAAGGTTGAPPVAAKRNSSSSEGASKPERVSWTRAEDETILQSVQELGHNWNKLAERLPGRTDHAIRNRFHRLQTMLDDKQREYATQHQRPEPQLFANRIFEAERLLQPYLTVA